MGACASPPSPAFAEAASSSVAGPASRDERTGGAASASILPSSRKHPTAAAISSEAIWMAIVRRFIARRLYHGGVALLLGRASRHASNRGEAAQLEAGDHDVLRRREEDEPARSTMRRAD